MVQGDITDVYYEEFNGEVRASEVKWFLGDIEKSSEEDIDWIKTFVKCACVNEDYDDLSHLLCRSTSRRLYQRVF
jgi:hypothetical protein